MNKFSFSSSPAWSIPQRYGSAKLLREGGVPGPGSYMLGAGYSKGTPAWKIGTSKRDGKKDLGAPGPGAYNVNGSNNAPKHTFGSKTQSKGEIVGIAPGPGSYNPRPSSIYKSSQGITLGAKYNGGGDKDSVPGPGAYSSNFNNHAQHPAVTIGNSKREGYHGDANPGPGAYAAQRPFSAGPQYGFGRSEKRIEDEVTPGPGQYELKNFLEFDKSKGVTLSHKHDSNLVAGVTPGPGQYNLSSNNGNRPNTPGVRIGTSNRQNKLDSSTPGPGQYLRDYQSRYSQGVKIGTSQRGFGNQNLTTPGPGSYDLLNQKHKHGITISGHKYIGSKDDVPGPGTYNPNANAVHDRPATAKIGRGKRTGEFVNEAPGPGHYTYIDGINGPKFAFTRQLRGQRNRNRNPGPADYEIPASIPNVPNYIMSSVHSASGVHH